MFHQPLTLRSTPLGVADGVGSTRRHPGGDPGRYSLQLMDNCRTYIEMVSVDQITPMEVLAESYRAMQETDELIRGGAGFRMSKSIR